MGRKPKYTAAQKVWAAEQYLGGSKSTSEIAAALGMSRRDTSTIRQWGRLYKNNGPDIFINRPHNRSYSLEFKEQVCREYLSGKGSYKELAARHGISSHGVVRQWVKKYTGSMNQLKDYDPQPEVYMTQRKKTTFQQRKEAVEWYFDHDCSYKKTAAQFGYSYTQVRDWVIKYKDQGDTGLEDRRGKRKAEEWYYVKFEDNLNFCF